MSRFISIQSASGGLLPQNKEEFKSYLQNQEYIKDISGVINSSSAQYVKAMGYSFNKLSNDMARYSANQIQAKGRSTELIVGALDKGFDKLSQDLAAGFSEVNSNLIQIQFQLSELNSQIQNLAGLIDIKLSALIEQQKITNYKLQQILEFAKIPDFQKERIYYLENGLKYLKNAQTEPKRYEDALENLKEAENREKRDYLTLYNIGLIYLFSSKLLDITAAEDYFLRAVDYAKDEIPESSVKSIDLLHN